MSDTPESPETIYRRRSNDFGVLHVATQRQSRRTGDVGLGVLLIAIVLWAVAFLRNEAPWFIAAGVFTIAFVVTVVRRNRLNLAAARYGLLVKINDEGIARLQRNWSALPAPLPFNHTVHAPTSHGDIDAHAELDAATILDLDLLGVASLEHLLGTPNTPAGKAALRGWVLRPAAPETVRLRQPAVAELSSQVVFREEVALRGRLVGATQQDYERLVAWAESPAWLHEHRVLIWVTRLLPIVVMGLIIALVAGWSVLPVLVGVLAINLALAYSVGRRVNDDIAQVVARQHVFDAYADVFGLIVSQSFVAPELKRLQAALQAHGHDADDQISRLARLMPLADVRRSIYFFPIEIATLWSFHLLWQLENWKLEAGRQLRGWLATLGELEAISALATLHYDQPSWVFPAVQDTGEVQFAAKDLTHPLLPPERAVGNDVSVGPPGTFLLVTGSNMSGKSTLLRSIGVNIVLAQMGAPVSATMLQMPSLVVATSMRVQDSLDEGVSFFMAELRRLKTIVDLADTQAQSRAQHVFYLLDEILQGTNTAERQIAARRIILHLVRSGAIGAVSTHDLTLAAEHDVAAAGVPVYFTEQFARGPEGATMKFDYKLRPGIATSTNALKLMEIIGLASGSLDADTGAPG